MTCIEAEPHVSALSDGEPISAEAGEHIRTCAACRTALAEYAQIGSELRIAAATDARPLPVLELPQRRRTLDLVWDRVRMPRFALAALIIAAITAGASVRLMSAQQRALWLQFGYTLDPDGPPSNSHVARAGFDQTQAMMMMVNGAFVSTYLRISVQSVSDTDVVLRYRAVHGNVDPTTTGETMKAPGELPLNGAPAIHYKPGQQLTIPVEGGGSVYLRGDVYDQQPKIAFGVPLEPPSDQLSVRGPVLIADEQVLAEMSGGGATALPGWAVRIGAEHEGTFLFALSPFAGSTQGQMEWGQMTFTLDGRRYHLVAAGPLTSGDQPRPVWVRHDLALTPGKSIGTMRLAQ